MLQLPSPAELSSWLREECERWHVPGMAVSVAREDDMARAATGVSDLESGAPVGSDTVFRIASITKPFVAALALTFVEEGRLALDEPLPGAPEGATLRRLLSHQSGLACEWPSPLDAADRADDAMARLLVSGTPETLPVGPGELFSYSNAGFWYVGAAIAVLAGTTFEEAMRARVLDPLRLGRTTFDAPPEAARGHNQVSPGADEHRPVAEDSYPRVRRPSGGLWSSVDHLSRFAAHQLGGPGPLSAASLAEMQTAQVTTAEGAYGLGWDLRESGGRGIVEHGGSAAGFESLLLLVPEEQLAFSALTNSSRGTAAIRGVLERLGLGREQRDDVALRADQLAQLAGRYRGQGLTVHVSVEGSGLSVKVSEHDPLEDEELDFPAMSVRPIGEREFEFVDGEWRGDVIDFPRPGLVRFGVVAARVT